MSSLLLGGFLVYYAIKEMYIESGVSKDPTPVTLQQLEEGKIPDNKHLLVTVGLVHFSKKLEYVEKRRSTDSVPATDDYYIPATDYQTETPQIFFRVHKVTKDLNGFLSMKKGVRCILVPHFDVPDLLLAKLAEKYGRDVSNRAIILDAQRIPGIGRSMFWTLGLLGLGLLTFSALALWMKPLPLRFASTVTKIHRIAQIALWIGIVAFFFFGDSVLSANAREGTNSVIMTLAVLGSLLLLLAAQSIRTCLIEERT